MKEIKRFFTETLSSVWYMGFAFLFGLIAMCMMFAPAFYTVWGPFELGSRPVAATQIFFDGPNGFVGAWPAFVGYLLVIVGFVATGLTALPFFKPSAKTEKIILLGSIALEIVGLFLVSLIVVEFNGMNHVPAEVAAGAYLKGGTISFIIFDILCMGCTSMAAFLDW